MPTYEQLGFGQGASLTGDRARSVFGHVMGLVACTLGFAALGAYIARDLNGGGGIIFFLLAFGGLFGLNHAAARGRESLATAMLFGVGLLLGLAVGPILNYYAHANPGAVYEAAGSTGLFVAALGTYGYSTRRDLSVYMRGLLWAFLAVFVFGLVALFVAIPGSNIIYCVAMLVIFGGFTAFDFQRLARNPSYQTAAPIAAAIFLDIFNVFLLLLSLFGGGSSRR
ncbi:Bax inhibitor-1 family protein [Conexibacter sp. DBS9H8]|uniref:Bax inhibitor-1/YccA family protein n=1 Tax=Conexibacter sp. DBS9H8 TaxID=2937801 RepID=UPI00200CF7FF|nr:Bax inhibitor-1 family protein [Conexibacter sp. DBS9H8]